MNILVIDDETIIHESIRKPLAREGFKVDSVLSAREGLEQLSKESYDLVITDLMMPEIDGLELLREIKKASYDVPTIMITGYPTIRTAMQALRLGAADYLPKPFTRKEILSPVRRALRRRGQESRSRTSFGGDEADMDSLTADQEDEGSKDSSLFLPGDRYCLPEHSWLTYRQDGRVSVGIEDSCLRAVGSVEKIELPLVNDLVEQGFPAMKLLTRAEEHNIFLPVSGRVVNRNQNVLENASRISADTWLLQVVPTHLREEIQYLRKVSPKN